MTGQLNDIWVAYLQGQGYTGKQYNDLVRQALQDQTSSARKQVDDLWKTYLEGEGYSGSVQDMMYAWLGDKGYTGSLNDRWKQAIENDDVFGGLVDDLFGNGEQGWWWSGVDITKVYQDELGTVPVTAEADPIRYITDLSGNENHFSTTTSVPQWDASSPFSGIGTVRSQGTSDRITFPNIGSTTGQFYLVWDGSKSIVCNAQFNVINAYHRTPHNLVAAVFIDRAFTNEEVAALDALYQDTIDNTETLVYNGMFEQMPITDVVTDLSGFGISGPTSMFKSANKLTEAPSFPLKGNITAMFNGCSSLTTMPNVDASEVSRTNGTWQSCSSLTSFPPLDLSGSDDYANCWRSCGLTSFSGVDFSNSTGDFDNAWLACTALSDFGANMFDTCVSTNFSRAFELCALTETSVDNILVSIDNAGTSSGILDIDGGTNSAPGTAGVAAIANLTGRGWTVTTN